MKALKKILFVVAFFAVAVSASAQISWGVKAGFNASNMTGLENMYKEEGASYSNNYKPGFHLGVVAQYMFTPQAGIESGLHYSMLGTKEEYTFSTGGVNIKLAGTTDPSYLQLPVMFIYKFNIGENLYLYPSLGIYMGYGIAGKYKFNVESNGVKAGVERNFFGEDNVSGNAEIIEEFYGDNLKNELTNRFDMGASVGINLQYSKFTIGLGYDYGLLKVNKDDNVDTNNKKMDDFHNSNVKVSVGYFF